MPILLATFTLCLILYLKQKFKEMQAPANENQQVIDEEEEDDDEFEAEEPLRKIRIKVMGQEKKYYYLKTVKTLRELDIFRFKVM
jgi:hypothetical protein